MPLCLAASSMASLKALSTPMTLSYRSPNTSRRSRRGVGVLLVRMSAMLNFHAR